MNTSTSGQEMVKHAPAFQRGWRSLPYELKLMIMEYILNLDGSVVREEDYRGFRNGIVAASQPQSRGRFFELVLPLLACNETANVASDVWYGKNPFFLGGQPNSGFGDFRVFPWLIPNRSAFVHLQHLQVCIRADYQGWIDLADYCEATKDMPKLRVFEVEFANFPAPAQGQHLATPANKTLEYAQRMFGDLTVRTRKLILMCRNYTRGYSDLAPLMQDGSDVPHALDTMANLNIEVPQGSNAEETIERCWHDTYSPTEVFVDRTWGHPNSQRFPVGMWHKRMYKTQWL